MSESASAKIVAHLQRKWGSKPCPMCGQGSWSVSDKTFQLMEYSQGGLVIGGPVLPVVPVSCLNCGNTVMVNAIIAKVVEPSAASDEEKPK